MPESAKLLAFVPLKVNAPDHVDGVTVIRQTLAPAAKGAVYVPKGHVTAVDGGLLMMIESVVVAASA